MEGYIKLSGRKHVPSYRPNCDNFYNQRRFIRQRFYRNTFNIRFKLCTPACRYRCAPACPLGSTCTDIMTLTGIMDNEFGGFIGNPLGAVYVIPTCAIACFTHSAI